MSDILKSIYATLFIILIFRLLVACDHRGNGPGQGMSDSLRAANLVQLDDQSWCDSLNGFGICPIGVYFVQIGDSLVPDSLILPPGASVTSTGHLTMVTFPTGEVQIETDSADYVSAIRVQEPTFRTRHGIGIGTELSTLVDLYPGFIAHFLPVQNRIQIIAAGAPNIVYLFDASNLGLKDSLPEVSSLPMNLKIGEIDIVP